MRYKIFPALLVPLALAACGDEGSAPEDRATAAPAGPAAEQANRVTLISRREDPRFTPEELARGRNDPAWRRVVQLDSVTTADTASNPEKWENISPQTVNAQATHLPLHGDAAGPSVLKAQILLDRALFSPGVIDGNWGKNTEKALYWLQRREGLPATGRLDRATFERLVQLAGRPAELVRAHQLTAEDVEGPFLDIPDDIYEKEKLSCMCYESLGEKLGERFHTTPELLAQLNPGVELDGLKEGERLFVPNVREEDAAQGVAVSRLVVSGGGFYLHGVDESGRILYHFPTTLGSEYSPSPSGDYRVTNVTPDPTWHYQPDILHGVEDTDEEALIPPGPNNAVGVVWMALSKPHFGIHGTSAPETIGYTTSNGCVRLTNWDARFLSTRIEPGIPVEFRDVDDRASGAS